MIRKFALATLSQTDTIIDKMELDLVTAPTGLGFSLEVSTIKTGVEEILVRASHTLSEVSLTANFLNPNAYQKAKALRYWLGLNTKKRMAFVWENDAGTSLADCIVTKFDVSEMGEDRVFQVPLSIRMLSPFFDLSKNEIVIKLVSGGKVYPYSYPYSYGSSITTGNEITNDYIEESPLIVKLFGEMDNVGVSLTEKGSEKPYAQVAFTGLVLKKGAYLTINAITKKITIFDPTLFPNEQDAYKYLVPSKDAFLYAKGQAVSILTANVTSTKTGYLEATYRKYRL